MNVVAESTMSFRTGMLRDAKTRRASPLTPPEKGGLVSHTLYRCDV